MFKKIWYILFSCCLISVAANSQQTSCGTLGQSSTTAFPVCGVDTFSILSVPECGGRLLPTPCRLAITDINPYFYKFTCFTSGTLGFLITPKTITDDYDWQIFDITNRNPDDIYTDKSLFVACNWSGDGGTTGTNATGASLSYCDGVGVPRFSKMPNLIQGHEYILLVSHFDGSTQSGYSLAFGGGTANITDPLAPDLMAAKASCDGTKISVKLNKNMKCTSLAKDGSDFSISPAIFPIISAIGVNCTNGFDMDSVVITLGGGLPPGNYTVQIEMGSDGNNLLDNCNNGIPNGKTLPVVVLPVAATPMDSLTKTGCAPDVLELIFKQPMLCNSIAADGSDFRITGPTSVTVLGATGNCNNGVTNSILVTLSAPIQNAGAYRLVLQTGSDGNTVRNECSVETPAGSSLPFTTVDTVSALFKSTIRFGCVTDTVNYLHDGRNGVNSWLWNFDNTITRTVQNTQLIYSTFGTKQATLIVSNGTCSDTASAVVLLNNNVTADFEATAVVCPGDPAIYTDKSTGPVVAWSWNFGNGSVSTKQAPPSQLYPSSNTVRDIPIRLIVKNSVGCADTFTHTIRVVGNCYIAIPKAFSPNNDGLNDYLYPTNAYKATNLLFRVFNRAGQKIFETRDWMTKWDGTLNGNPQDPGTFVWTLSYTNIETGKRFELKGSTVLIR
ncbi:hypothetical protein BH11BAC3_BH11BAC3_31430 [soil metagenome]